MDQIDWRFAAGRGAFLHGREAPSFPAEINSLEGAFWLGYMLARGKKLMEQMRVRDALSDFDWPPNPPEAA